MSLIQYAHHVTLHVPLVMSLALGALGVVTWRAEHGPTCRFIRWAGWATLAVCLGTIVTGFLSAPDPLNQAQEAALGHHRNLAIMTGCIVLLAAAAYEAGVRHDAQDVRRLGVGLWAVAGLSALGTGHWGGWMLRQVGVIAS